jgi:hypothetical protein
MSHGTNINMDKANIDAPVWSVAVHALIQFDTLERLIKLGQNVLDAELNDLHSAMDEDYKAFESEDDEGDYLAHVNDEYTEVTETLPCLYWYSQFLIAYSFFERALNALSISFQKQNGAAASLKDMSGQGIARARIYLAKVCGITAPFALPEWQRATLLTEIRNVIAHTSGYVDYLPNDKRALFSRLKGEHIELKTEIANQEDAQIILTREFVLGSIKVYRVLLSEIGGLGRDFITPKHGSHSALKPKAVSDS